MPIPQLLELYQKGANVELVYFSGDIPLRGVVNLHFSYTNDAHFLTQLSENLKSQTGIALEPLDAKRSLVRFNAKWRKQAD